MKILITGVTGRIGRAVLDQCLKHPHIASIVALVRRELPLDFIPSSDSNRGKFSAVIVKDFGDWSNDILEHIKDANAMIWTIGTYDANENVNCYYPLAFQNAFLKYLTKSSNSSPSRFRFIHLSGALVIQDQSTDLWFMPAPRKIKGLAETKMLEFAKEHANQWQTFILRPGGVLGSKRWYNGLVTMTLGQNLAIEGDELGAAMALLAVDGEKFREDEGVVLNRRIIEMGRGVLRS